MRAVTIFDGLSGRFFFANAAPIAQSDQTAVIEPYQSAWNEITQSGEMVGLVATEPVKKAADAVSERARDIVTPDLGSTAEQLDRRNSELAAAEETFRTVARKELLLTDDRNR